MAQGGCNPSDVRVCGKVKLTFEICCYLIFKIKFAVNITRLPCNFTAKLTEEEDSSDDGQLGSGDIDPVTQHCVAVMVKVILQYAMLFPSM